MKIMNHLFTVIIIIPISTIILLLALILYIIKVNIVPFWGGILLYLILGLGFGIIYSFFLDRKFKKNQENSKFNFIITNKEKEKLIKRLYKNLK